MMRLIGLVAIFAVLAAGCAAADYQSELEGASQQANATGTTATSDLPSAQQSQGTSTPPEAPGTEPSEESEPPVTDEDSSTTSTVPSTTTAAGAGESAGSPSSGYGGPLADLVAIAVADLVQRLSIAASEIAVVSAESVVWPDGSLGCPNPDMRYTQVQVDGTKIVLSVDGGVYTYHSGGNRDPFLCVPTKATSDTGSGGEQSLPTTTIGLDE